MSASATCDVTPGSVRIKSTVVDDRLLIRWAQRGDQNAFEALYREHSRKVFALCRRLSGDPVLAEDLTQEVFVRAWQGLPSFRGEAGFATWIHRVAVNVVLGQRRHSACRPDFAGDAIEDTAHARLPTTAGQSPTVIDLERAIDRLPDGARTVFVLHDIEGFNHREIAASAGIAEGTSKAHLHRARRMLREYLS